MKKLSLLLLLAVLLTLSACASSGELEPSTDAFAASGAQQSAPVGGLESTAPATQAPTQAPTEASTEAPTQASAEAPAVSAYAEGTYKLTAALGTPPEAPYMKDELIFVDGKLSVHFYLSSEIGKGGYGPDCSDPLEFSPCVNMTVEEAVAYYENQGCTVTVEEQ